MAGSTLNWCAVVASNDASILDHNLMRSPELSPGGVTVRVERGALSAGEAYNRGLDATDAPIVVFVHQDVYLPVGWGDRLAAAVEGVRSADPDWAVLSVYGIDLDGVAIGPVWSSSVGRVIGEEVQEARPIQSMDELAIVLRREAGLRFDERLPGFHLYGTDMVQTAREAGFGAWGVSLPLVHNDGFHDRLGADFSRACQYMRAKWRNHLPIRTPVLRLSRLGHELAVKRLRMWRSRTLRAGRAADVTVDPRVYAARCGWEDGIG